jgi:hypothetical protein
VLVYDPETNSFVLDRVASISRLTATRGSRANTLNGQPSYTIDRPAESVGRNRSKSNDDVPKISLDSTSPTTSARDNVIDLDSLDGDAIQAPVLPIVTPRIQPTSPIHARGSSSATTRKQEIISSDDDSEIDIGPPSNALPRPATAADEEAPVAVDDDVSDEDLDDLANELESSLENRLGSSSEEVDDSDGPPRANAPDFGNVPRSGGPISMNRFAGGRRRLEEEEESSSDDDDD